MNASANGFLQDMLNTTNITYCQQALGNASFTTNCTNNFAGDARNTSAAVPAGESQASLIIRFSLTAIIFVLIVVGNSLTIHVVRNNRNLTSIKNYYYGYYIVNLSISDLLVGLVCLPTTVLYYIFPGRWKFGLFLCKLFPTLQIIVVSASISTLTVITFERFSAIVHPLQPRSTLRKLKIRIIAIWIFSTMIASPSFLAYEINSDQMCEERGISQWYTIMLFLVNYAVPLAFIFLTYLRMLYELRKQAPTGSKRELTTHKRFIKLTIILVLSFALCYLPGNIIFFVFEYTVVQMDPQTLTTMLQYFHILVWVNSCLNPFIYGSVDTYFKRGFKKAFGLGSSCDSQDKTTNLSRVSTFRSEKPSPSLTRWLPQDSPSNRSVRSNGSSRSVRFQSFDSNHRDSLAGLQKSNLNNNPEKQSLINEKGYVSLVLYQSNNCSNFTLADTEENKELFVDLNSSSSNTNKISLEKVIMKREFDKMLQNNEFLREFHRCRETNL